jgi:hypothetical protein
MSHLVRSIRGVFGVGLAAGLAALAMACEKPIDSNEATSADNAALTATQQCLHQATNQEIIDELQARLAASGSSSGGTTSGDSAAVSFVCDNFANLQFSVVGPNGQEHKDQVTIGSSSTCNDAAQKLNQTRASITHTSLFGVCDNFANLNRWSVTPDGTLTKLSSVTIGSSSTCASQADAMNH